MGTDLWGWGHAQPAPLGNPQTMALCFQGCVCGNCSCLPKPQVPVPVSPSLLPGARTGCQTVFCPPLLCLCPFLRRVIEPCCGEGTGEWAEPLRDRSRGPGTQLSAPSRSEASLLPHFSPGNPISASFILCFLWLSLAGRSFL